MKIIHTGLAFRADKSGKKTSIRIQDMEGARYGALLSLAANP
jgi:hypothetical protein